MVFEKIILKTAIYVWRRRKYKHTEYSIGRIRKFEKEIKNGVEWKEKEMEQECDEYSEGSLSKIMWYKKTKFG